MKILVEFFHFKGPKAKTQDIKIRTSSNIYTQWKNTMCSME